MELSVCEQLEALFPEATVIRSLTMATSQRTQVGINAVSLKQQSIVLPLFAFLYKKVFKALFELGLNDFDFLIKVTILKGPKMFNLFFIKLFC